MTTPTPAVVCIHCGQINACRHNHLPLTWRGPGTPEYVESEPVDFVMEDGKLVQK